MTWIFCPPTLPVIRRDHRNSSATLPASAWGAGPVSPRIPVILGCLWGLLGLSGRKAHAVWGWLESVLSEPGQSPALTVSGECAIRISQAGRDVLPQVEQSLSTERGQSDHFHQLLCQLGARRLEARAALLGAEQRFLTESKTPKHTDTT